MPVVSNIKLKGFDPARPPRIGEKPYIDLCLELDQQAPRIWCAEFVTLVGKPKYAIRIDPAKGLFIEAWVRKTDEISAVISSIKDIVLATNRAYERRVNVVAPEAEKVTISPEQQALDNVISALVF